jgi:hypothetical protein
MSEENSMKKPPAAKHSFAPMLRPISQETMNKARAAVKADEDKKLKPKVPTVYHGA